MALSDIKRRKPHDITWEHDLTIEWRDGVVVHYPYVFLRESCPCASCVDELTGEKRLDPARIPADVHIRSAAYVGQYALRIDWSDGHDTGIYSFAYLRELYDLAEAQGGANGGPHAQAS